MFGYPSGTGTYPTGYPLMSDDIERLLGEVVANQRNMVAEQKRVNALLEKHFEDDKTQFGGLNKRLRHIEQKINYAAGAVAILSAVAIMFWEGLKHTLTGT